MVHTPAGGIPAGDTTRVVSLLHRLTDVPYGHTLAEIEKLPNAERDRLAALAAEILRDRRYLRAA